MQSRLCDVVEGVKRTLSSLVADRKHKQMVIVDEQVNGDEDSCSSDASESLLSNSHGGFPHNTLSSTFPSSSRTPMTCEQLPVTAASAAAEADVAMATGCESGNTDVVARCEDDDDAIAVAETNDYHQSRSDAAITSSSINNNNNVDDDKDFVFSSTQQPLSSACCVLDASRLSATTFHRDAAVSRFSDTVHLSPGL